MRACKLAAIQGDTTRQAEIIARHLPFGAHTSSHASQGGPDHEDLLLQEGYALRHDQDAHHIGPRQAAGGSPA